MTGVIAADLPGRYESTKPLLRNTELQRNVVDVQKAYQESLKALKAKDAPPLEEHT